MNKPTKKPPLVFTVDRECQLLEFLLASLKNEGRNKVKALLKYRAVSVGTKTITKFDYPLRLGQTVSITASVESAKKCPLDILYEDDDIIAVNKPAGLLSIATDKELEHTAYHILMEYVREDNVNNRVFIVHRLDRDTSGVLIIAKNEKMKHALQDKWNDLVKTRGYICVVEGTLEEKSGTLRSFLQETKTHLIYSAESGLEAITDYKVIKEGKMYSLVEVDLQTGRKNQIRVQMQDIGHSIVGDKKYGAANNPIKRLCLHANKLALIHPYTNELLTFVTPMPKGFNALLRME